MSSVRRCIRELTDPRRCAGVKDLRWVIEDLNPVLRGWGNYSRTGNASLQFQTIHRLVRGRFCG
jgi:hypothetical protein